MPFSQYKGTVFAAALALTAAPGAYASMGNIATTYGVLPTDVGSAQALSLFNSQISATYYNPANLTKDPRGSLTIGLLHAEPELRAEQLDGNANAPERDGSVLSNQRSQHVLIGMKTDLSSMTTARHPLYLGFVAGVEKYGRELLAFESEKAEEGQFLEYGRQPLFLNIGVGTQVWRGIDVGLAARITLHAEANLTADTTLDGETSREKLGVEAKPFIRPIGGINVDMGETICPDASCWADGLELAAAYRAKSNSQTSVNADATVENVGGGDPIPLRITTLDSFQPEVYALGVQYEIGSWRLGATGEHQRWSQLTSEFRGDTIRNDGDLEFRDTWVPRLAAEYNFHNMFSVMGGVAYEKSPLRSSSSPEVNYLDNDRLVVGLGGSYTFCNLPYLAQPVRLDVGYQYHWMDEREFELINNQGTSDESRETVNTDGHAHVFVGSLSIAF